MFKIEKVLNEGFLFTGDIKKAFDSANHLFLIVILAFIDWINILLNNQESCVINGGKTSKNFKLERGTRKGDPISAYLLLYLSSFSDSKRNIKY